MDRAAQIHQLIRDYLTDQKVEHQLYEVGITVQRGDETWFITALSVAWAPGFLHVLNVREFEMFANDPQWSRPGWWLADVSELTEGTNTVAFVFDDDEDPFGDHDHFSAHEPRQEYLIDFEDPQLLPKVLKEVR